MLLTSVTSKNVSTLLKVRLGEYDVSVTTEQLPYEELDVSHVMVHPQFNNLSLANDIALLRFVRPARRRSHIDVACMPHPGQIEEIEGTRCIVTGWGRKSEGTEVFLLFFFFISNQANRKYETEENTHVHYVLPESGSLFSLFVRKGSFYIARLFEIFLIEKKIQLSVNKSATIVDRLLTWL